MEKGAHLSICKQYRYSLFRRWDYGVNVKRCLFVMLNPSTADAELDDPTIKKCIKIANYNGCGAMEVVNLCPFRSPHPKEIVIEPVEISQENNLVIKIAAEKADLVIFAWGNLPRSLKARPEWIKPIFKEMGKQPRYLKLTKDGNPSHPLARGKAFIPYTQKLTEYPL